MKMNTNCFLRTLVFPTASLAFVLGLMPSLLRAQEAVVEEAIAGPEPGTEIVLTNAEIEAAALKELPEDAQKMTADVQTVLIENQDRFTELLSKARSRAKEENDFAEAFKFFDEAKEVLLENPISANRSVLEERLKEERREAQRIYGESLFSQAMKDYTKLLQMSHDEDIIEFGNTIVLNLTYADNVYILGALPGQPVDSDSMRREISRDKDKSEFNKRVQALRTKVQNIVDGEKYSKEASLSEIDPRYEERSKEIALLYRTGEFLYQNDRFTEARDKMEQILIKDPYNEMAITMLERIYRKLYAIADMRVYNELLRESAQTEWAWVENIPDNKNIIATEGPKIYTGSENELFNRLNSIIIEHIEFSDSSFPEAIAMLRTRSKDFDPEGKGINIILINPERFDRKENENKYRITLELDQVPIYEVIRYICKQTDLAFRINEADKTLTIGTATDVSDMVRRYIPIRQGIISRIVSDMGDAAEAEYQDDMGAVDSSFANVDVNSTFTTGVGGTESMRRVQSVTANALKKYFIENGIPFEEGSSVAYDSRANKLTVVNTPENVRQLELAVRDMDVQDPLIMIESKMFEITMNDLEELGFDWTVARVNPDDMRWYTFLTSPNISANYSNNKLINGLNLVPNFGPGGTWNVFLTVNAVDRTDRAEILCTPKVVTKSGKEAQIQMVRQMYFPESWTEPEINTSCGSTISFEPSYPEFGSAREVGTSLTVLPTLGSNNYAIRLALLPSVTDLTGWSDYSYEYVIGDFKSGQTHPMTLKMPEISVRSVETNVKVYDGQTVVIGGILADKQGSVGNKWPIFGDIPIIGRFFTESAHSAAKDNLIVSVTARLISGDGIPVRSNTQNGLPDFRR